VDVPEEARRMTMPRPKGARGDRASGTDARCACGSLLARILPHGVELKCRRCRRHALVAIDASGRFVVQGALVDEVASSESAEPPATPAEKETT
jgi:hypothetical protein